MRRTHTCGELSAAHAAETVTLCGWVQNRRDHGGVIFIDLRDRYGLTQIVFDPDEAEGVVEFGHRVRGEWVLQVTGLVEPRPEGMVNPKMPTGEIEVRVRAFEVLSRAETPPFTVDDYGEAAGEELRLKYRYLDLRRPSLQRSLVVRHRALQASRRRLTAEGFVEVETPMLAKSTPEGARDYLVPSRVHPGQFYALPQSPQLFKQILMVSGLDRYFQLCRCFRDEDLRADRQPEFTQIDLEMSFAEPDDVFALCERLMQEIFAEAAGRELAVPFPRLTHAQAMARYGIDKPDIRFGMELRDVGELVRESEFRVFTRALEAGGVVKAMRGPGLAEYSRKQMDDLAALAATQGAQGLAYIKVEGEGKFSGPLVKFFSPSVLEALAREVEAAAGDTILFGAGPLEVVNASLAFLRNRLGRDLGLYDPDRMAFVWITDFPLFEWDAQERRWTSSHHPFTMPHPDDVPLLDELGQGRDVQVRSSSYDLVLNGVELASGSVRIHDRAIQHKVFEALALDEQEIQARFGFFLEALRYGAPPHAGIAVGFDRLVAMLLGCESIRDVIAFPKTQKAQCPLTGAPSAVADRQLRELGISVRGGGAPAS